MAKLAEQSLPILGGSKPVIGKIYIEHLLTVNCIEKTKIKKNMPGMAHFLIGSLPHFGTVLDLPNALMILSEKLIKSGIAKEMFPCFIIHKVDGIFPKQI